MTAPSPSLLELVPELGQSNVRILDPKFVENALITMQKDAPHKLQIVADFDSTLSKYSENGQECNTTHGVLEQSDFLSEKYRVEAVKLKRYYLPIEFDINKPVEEKIPKMIEWWSKSHSLLADCGLTRENLSVIVAKSRVKLRDGCAKFFDRLHKLNIPILIFSAGIGDVIAEAIKQQAHFYETNMKLVSNFLHFDESGKMTGIAGEEIIHTFNKNESAIHSSDYFENLRHRENLILVGDSLGDLGMAEGADNVECMLKVGFLNFKVQENLSVYLQKFDIVIIEDESLDVVNGIIKAISPAIDS